MGWNMGYKIMEHTVVTLYDAGALNPALLNEIMEPYKDTDCDSGGSKGLKTRDDKGVEEVICSIMSPEKYKDVIENPEYYPGEPEEWASNKRAAELFDSIWRGIWGIW